MRWRFPDKPIEITPEEAAKFLESDWIVQAKLDGWNTSIYIDTEVRCFSRMGEPMERVCKACFDCSIPEQIRSLNLPPNTILATEFVGPRGHHDPAVYIFDCFAYNGQWLTTTPFEDRWNYCTSLELKLKTTPKIHLAETRRSGFIAFFEELKNAWLQSGKGLSLTEGIVLKRKSGTLILDSKSSRKNASIFKCKFRDARYRRW
jgi:ATP-dependent DNA ligase